MLNPKNNRLDYGSILSPPNNYELDFAIGTTYTLDLDALVGASISLGLSTEIDSDLNKNPIFLLEALRSTGDKVALFCESGQIKLPNKPTPLYIHRCAVGMEWYPHISSTANSQQACPSPVLRTSCHV